jgi:putative CocE/NonD family hydrolase
MHIPTLLLVLAIAPWADGPDKISEFGRYEGYSEARFESWVTTSRYLEMRDGVRLAVDVTRPAVDGAPTDEPLPVVWTHSRYHRNPGTLAKLFAQGQEVPEIRSMVDAMPDLQLLVRHGYVVAAVGVRGSGASFGRFEGLFSEAETADAAEVIAWLAAQEWCDGNVGMYGGSYLGITQYMAASRQPPALKAIFPVVAAFDMYDVIYPGGVFREDMIRHWDGLTRQLDTEWAAPPVDGDDDGALLRAAMEAHESNWNTMAEYRAGRFRDHDVPTLAYARHGPWGAFDEVRQAAVPAYHWNGWLDVFVTDATLWFVNYTGPQKLGIGAWPHGGSDDAAMMAERMRLRTVEQHRWFDRWLKGIDNGVDREPAVHYALMEEPGTWRWITTETWPPAEARPVRYHFAAGPSGSIASLNDGVLSVAAPGGTAPSSHDRWVVDRTTTTGSASRWDNAVGAAPVMRYPDLVENDRKCLTYTTPPLERDVVVTGHPVVTLFVTATAEDADFYVLLEEVDETGAVRYVSATSRPRSSWTCTRRPRCSTPVTASVSR